MTSRPIGADDPKSARVQTLSIFALMVGTLQVSRALADRRLADDVLDQGIQNALALLGMGVRLTRLERQRAEPAAWPKPRRRANRARYLSVKPHPFRSGSTYVALR